MPEVTIMQPEPFQAPINQDMQVNEDRHKRGFEWQATTLLNLAPGRGAVSLYQAFMWVQCRAYRVPII